MLGPTIEVEWLVLLELIGFIVHARGTVPVGGGGGGIDKASAFGQGPFAKF